MAEPSLILASRSPRRRELLALFGLPFRIVEADMEEIRLTNEEPADMTRRLARMKAESVAAKESKCWIVGGDTMVSIADDCLGKPQDPEEACHMLSRLSGRCHEVISAVALVGPGFAKVAVSHTRVKFMPLTQAMIRAYCATDEPYDKAGGYGIQGFAGTFVREIRGSYSGVVGLPLYETRQLLQHAGLL